MVNAMDHIWWQVFTWANADPDLSHHMMSLVHNELTHSSLNEMADVLPRQDNERLRYFVTTSLIGWPQT